MRTPEYILTLSRNMRKNQTLAENIFWQGVRNRKLEGYKFKRQFPIGRYIADFYCHEARIVIEIDGKIHEDTDKKEYDKIRQEEIEARNVKVLRFSNQDIITNWYNVLNTLKSSLKPLSRDWERGLG